MRSEQSPATGSELWRSLGGDTRSSGYKPEASVPTEGAQATSLEPVADATQRLGDEIDDWWYWAYRYSTIAADESHVYYTGGFDHDAVEGGVVAVNRATGETAWQFGPKEAAAWFRGGITVRGDTAVVGGIDGESEKGILFGIDTTSGTERWRQRVPGAVWMPPEWYDDTVYVASRAVQYTGTDRALLAVDPTDGTIEWEVPQSELPDRMLRTSPVVDDTGVYIAANWQTIAAYTHDGSQRWTTKIRGPIIGSPAADDKRVYATRQRYGQGYGDENTDVVALDKSNGQIDWRYQTESKEAQHRPAVTNDSVYIVNSDSTVICLSKTGDLRWKTKLPGTPGTPPTVADGLVFIGHSEQLNPGVVALRTENGRQRYSYLTDRYGPIGEIVVVDGAIWVLEANNRLHRLEPGSQRDTTSAPTADIDMPESPTLVGSAVELSPVVPETVDLQATDWFVTTPSEERARLSDPERDAEDPVSFQPPTPGEWTVELWVQNEHDNWGRARESFLVREPTPTPTPTETPTETPMPTTTTEGPGFGVVSTLLGAGGAASLLRRLGEGSENSARSAERDEN
ncbi:hypothetical protein JCM30237_24350 [Halolamina litorea]|uniref:PQQ-binding-like beta-propeller repeat protein n=1 Tax=Halolamina litorea TaxID=1515593 RepID=A0ABD6BV79_9EURY|nr:PQQ-like beta-propeller repeat protein [Halolamina litorea]